MTPVRVYGGQPTPKREEGSPLLAGLLGSIVIVVVWVGLVYVTHHAVGVAAWGVGGLLGIVVAKSAKPPTKATGALAAVLTLVTILLAKLVLVVAALQPIIRQELANDPGTLTALFSREPDALLALLQRGGSNRLPLTLLRNKIGIGSGFFPGAADPLLALAHAVLLPLVAFDITLGLILGMCPPQHQEEPELGGQHEDEGPRE